MGRNAARGPPPDQPPPAPVGPRPAKVVSELLQMQLAFDARIAGLSVQGWEAVVSLAEGALAAPR
jgi:hypothetical protein